MTDEEKKDLKKFNDYLIDWWKGNLEEFKLDSRYSNYAEKCEKGDSEILFARKMGGAIAINLAQKEFQERLVNNYCK